ncbi:MAG TPA: peptide-methionine (S)-S-oxide reductase MsrA [Rhizobiaceae bacterium]|nr:peptide-methionine (S)-S-oxide reductase MsrA [Rhizobiaceae bacterium]
MRFLAVIAFLLAATVLPRPAQAETALFAGGCFWCVEADFDSVPGVTATTTGYAGGKVANPTYKTYGKGGHREVVRIEFDPSVVSYAQLVAIFLRTIDPTDAGGQFCDRGRAYSTAIHALDERQRKAAEQAVKDARKLLGAKVATAVEGAARFWKAEQYHQEYYRSNVRQVTRFGIVTRATAYKGYRKNCGRDARVRKVWGQEAYKGANPGS